MKSIFTGSSAPSMEGDGVLGEPASSVYKLQGGSVGSREPGSVETMSVSTDRDVFKISRGVR